MNDISISIITLSKNNPIDFFNTFESIINLEFTKNIEWLILDGSNKRNRLANTNYINKSSLKFNKKLDIKYIDMNKKKIYGIYPTMNYAINVARGYSIIFMNSGDKFFNKNSLKLLHKNLIDLKNDYSFVFGQAKIISQEGLSWHFPGKNLGNFKKWLFWFEPNHQAMLITKKLALVKSFNEKNVIFADGLWKRNIIKNAKKIAYLPFPICKFYLGGLSSAKPDINNVRLQINLKEINILRKLIIVFKFLTPGFIYKHYPYFQKYKSLLFDLIF